VKGPILFHRFNFLHLSVSILLCGLSVFILAGCALLGGGNKQIHLTTIPAQSTSPVTIKATLKPIIRNINFRGFEAQTGRQRVRITVVNLGRMDFRMSLGTNAWILVTPNTPVEICNKEISRLTDSMWFGQLELFVNAMDSSVKIPCELHLEMSDPPRFLNEIKVYQNKLKPWF
jgi:hypothetical protein